MTTADAVGSTESSSTACTATYLGAQASRTWQGNGATCP